MVSVSFYKCKHNCLHRALHILFPCVGGTWSLPGSQGPPCNAHHPTGIGREVRKGGCGDLAAPPDSSHHGQLTLPSTASEKQV